MKLIKATVAMVLGFFPSVGLAQDQYWFEKMREIDRALIMTNEQEKIEALGRLVSIGDGGIREEVKPVFDKAQDALLAIPGHAKYYQDRIESLRAEVLTKSDRQKDDIPRRFPDNTVGRYWKYENFRREAFVVLRLLPSSENVAVLGHFLSDPEGLDGKTMLGAPVNSPDFMGIPASANAAALSLANLGIEHPPVPYIQRWSLCEYVKPEELNAWKSWWNEVQAGKRTYRFIGSNIDYGPDGPVARDKGQQIGPSRKGSAGSYPDQNPSPWFKPLAGILAACAFCLAAVWLFMRSRRKQIP